MRAVFFGEEFEGALLAVAEGAAELEAEEEVVGEAAEGAEGGLVDDVIADEGAGLALGGGAGFDGVAVAPVGEGAAGLDVAEAVEPAEVFDEGLPGETDGRVREGADGEGEAGAGAGGDAVGAGEGVGRGRRWDEVGIFDLGVLPGGHEAREVGGVGEEGEDALGGVREPLLGFEGVAHVLSVEAVSSEW